MEEIKRRFEFYSHCDCTGIEKHLKKMAEKGWMLESIGTYFWKYRRIEPQSLAFSVVYYAKKVDMGEITADRQRFIDEHSVAGWEFVANYGKIHVFCNKSENPVPLETNAAARVNSIHKFAKSEVTTSNFLFLALSLAFTLWFAYKITKTPIDILSEMLCKYAFLPLYIPFSLGGIIKYYLWYKKAAVAAEVGIITETKRIFPFDKLFFILWILGGAVKIYTFLSPAQMVFGAVAVMFGVLLIILFKALRRAYLKKEIAENAKRALTAVTAIVLIAGFVAGSFGIYGLFPKRSEKFKRKSEYSNNMINVTVYYDKNLPLDLEDLIPVEGVVSKYKSSEWLGFVNIKETSQFVLDKENTDFYCDIYYINCLPLYDACIEEIKGIFKDDYVSVDPAPWGANEAYRILYDDGYGNRFVICWDDRIAEMVFSWNPTDEQIAIASEKIIKSDM